MTGEPAAGEADPPPEPERMVTAIRVQCKECRRRRAGDFKGVRPSRGRCPHYRTVWAEGYGPGSRPPGPPPGPPDVTPPV